MAPLNACRWYRRTVEVEETDASIRAICPAIKLSDRAHRQSRSGDTRTIDRLLDGFVSPRDDGAVAGFLWLGGVRFHGSQRRLRNALRVGRQAGRQRTVREFSAVFLFLHRDAGDRRLRRHASADRLRPCGRDSRDIHRHVVSGRHDRPCLCSVLAAEGALRIRPKRRGDKLHASPDADDSGRQRAAQHDLGSDRKTLVHPQGA